MAQMIYQVDAFTGRPFGGNPAGVCLLKRAATEAWMQDVAREMHLSETAFLVPRGCSDGFDLRWFTPTTEVDLCGHATLSSAHILWQTGVLAPTQKAHFYTHSGRLSAQRMGDWITMDFPATPPESCDIPEGLEEAIGAPIQTLVKTPFDYLVEVASLELVEHAAPNFDQLKSYPVRGVVMTSTSAHEDYDFVSRFFAPAAGIDEDPVTGSTHCALGPYWQDKLGKTSFTARQASPRGGIIKVEVRGERVQLSGQAVTMLEGKLLAPVEYSAYAHED